MLHCQILSPLWSILLYPLQIQSDQQSEIIFEAPFMCMRPQCLILHRFWDPIKYTCIHRQHGAPLLRLCLVENKKLLESIKEIRLKINLLSCMCNYSQTSEIFGCLVCTGFVQKFSRRNTLIISNLVTLWKDFFWPFKLHKTLWKSLV